MTTFIDSRIRLAEICNLTVHDVNTKDGTLRVFGKGGKMRIVHVSEATAAALLNCQVFGWPEPLAEDYFFQAEMGDH